MTDNLTYALSSAGWFLLGSAVSFAYSRWYYHRLLVREGGAKREPRMDTVVAVLVAIVVTAGLLFTYSSEREQHRYESCQADVNQTNVDTINDRSKSAATQLRAEIRFLQSIAANPGDFQARIENYIAADQQRLQAIETNPLQPTTSCNKPDS